MEEWADFLKPENGVRVEPLAVLQTAAPAPNPRNGDLSSSYSSPGYARMVICEQYPHCRRDRHCWAASCLSIGGQEHEGPRARAPAASVFLAGTH